MLRVPTFAGPNAGCGNSGAGDAGHRGAAIADRVPSASPFVDPDSGRLVLSQNPDTPRSPASTIKVVTTFAALDVLGPAYTWHTHASIRGEIEAGVLDGDLYLQGGGDPYMTLERWWSFAQALRARGLKTIHGDIVIDNTAFSLPPRGSRRIRRPAESRLQRRAGRADGEFPIHRIPRGCPMPSARRVDVLRKSGTGQSRHRKSRALRRRPLRRRSRQSRFQGGLRALGSGGIQRRIVAALCGAQHYPRACCSRPRMHSAPSFELWRELGGEFTGKLRVEPAPADAQPIAHIRLAELWARSCASPTSSAAI